MENNEFKHFLNKTHENDDFWRFLTLLIAFLAQNNGDKAFPVGFELEMIILIKLRILTTFSTFNYFSSLKPTGRSLSPWVLS